MKPVLRVSLIILVIFIGLVVVLMNWTAIPGILKGLVSFVGVLAVLYAAVSVWALIPTRPFKPFTEKPIPPDYWPTSGFRASTPEDQGMDSTMLLQIVDYCNAAHEKDSGTAVDSITIIRNGYLVADLYFNPLFPKDTPHIIHSCTKSIMSALIGIAIEQGYIESVEVPLVDFFKDKQDAILDNKMAQIRLKDLLSMQTGLRSRDSFLYQWKGIFAMQATDDWVAYILGLPLDAEPGTRFDYSNLSSFLLSAIIQRATGMDTLAYARKYLFDPIGIGEVRWEWGPQGIAIGYARMWLKPRDMAKFGFLFLNQGRWDGRQIVPAAWVEASVTPHAFPKNYVEILDALGKSDQSATSRNWVSANFFRAFADGYGYQWWLDRSGSYAAVGVAGQYIMVVPRQNLVVAVTSSSSGKGVFFPKKVLDKFVLPAVKSNGRLPANLAAQKALAARSGPPPVSQRAQTVPALPSIARQISGNTYRVEENPRRYDHFRLLFDPELAHGEFSYTVNGKETAVFDIGLDGVYRFTETEIGCMAGVGSWTSPDTFVLTCHQIGYSAPEKFKLTFNQASVDVTEESQTGTRTYSGRVISYG